MVSTFLDIAGMVLIVVAAFAAIGIAGALLAAGACCLVSSWALSRASK